MSYLDLKRYIDLKLVLLLAGFYALFNLVFIIKQAYLYHYFPSRMMFSWYDFIIYNILIDWVVVVAYMTLIAISTKRLLNKNYSWVKIISLHTLFSILIGFIIRMFFDLIGFLAGHINPEDYELQESFHRFMMVVDLNFLIYFAMIFIIYTYYYLRQVKEVEKHRTLLETQLVNTRMKMLSSQLQPHFLFNTLNSISVLADVDAQKAKDTIADLSDFLREILYSSDENKITLEKELGTLEYYLSILNVRFSDHLQIKKEIDEDLLQFKVPALLLQPLIENSIKHGYSYDNTSLRILISARKEGGKIVITIENDGALLKETHANLLKKGVGLSNIDARLQNLYGRNYYFRIRNKKQTSGVETIVKFPAE